jgi:DNA-binding protein
MSQQPNNRTIVIHPLDTTLKVTDVVEKIISAIMETGEVDIIGIGDAIFLACSAINMATEIAKVHINDLAISKLESSSSGKNVVLSAYLGQKEIWDYSKAAEQEEKSMENLEEQTVSVSRAATMERLLTVSLLRLARFDKIRIVAAGGSISDAIALALTLTKGQISKDDVGTKLIHIYSISMRNDPTKNIAAISIFLQKGMSTEWTKRQNELFKSIETGKL